MLGCRTCFQGDTCQFCYPNGFFLKNQICLGCALGCKLCTEIDSCLTCMDGFYLNDKNICTQCHGKCAKCKDSKNCTECSFLYRLDSSDSSCQLAPLPVVLGTLGGIFGGIGSIIAIILIIFSKVIFDMRKKNNKEDVYSFGNNVGTETTDETSRIEELEFESMNTDKTLILK